MRCPFAVKSSTPSCGTGRSLRAADQAMLQGFQSVLGNARHILVLTGTI